MNNLNATIIFEDEYLVAYDKKSGLVVNRSNTHKGITLQDIVEDEVVQEDEIDNESGDYSSRSGILHRLDKDTSGVILVAKDPVVFADIQKQFKERKVHKVYKAVVIGEVKDRRISIDAPLARNPTSGFKFAIVSDGRDSKTDIEVVKVFNIEDRRYTSVNVMPKTGRTHQIRVHCAAINHCIVADPIYNTRKDFDVSMADFGRLMLHAYSVEIKHPKTGGRIILKSELPSEFRPYFA